MCGITNSDACVNVSKSFFPTTHFRISTTHLKFLLPKKIPTTHYLMPRFVFYVKYIDECMCTCLYSMVEDGTENVLGNNRIYEYSIFSELLGDCAN